MIPRKIKKSIIEYFNQKINEKKLPIRPEAVQFTVQLEEPFSAKQSWLKKVVPAAVTVVIGFSLVYLAFLTIFSPAPAKVSMTDMERIFSEIPQLRKPISVEPLMESKQKSDKDEDFLLELQIKRALHSIHRERINYLKFSDWFKHILTQKREKTETLLKSAEWSESDVLKLEKAIRRMIEKDQIYHILVKLKQSKEV